MIENLVKKNRSYRRFYEEKEITKESILELLELARFTPSAANKQSTRYMISCTPEQNEKVFSNLFWAGYLKEWAGPEKGERPSAYILVLAPVNENLAHDEGIKSQTILLGAAEKGLGGCIFGSIDRPQLMEDMHVPTEYKISLVIALGYPKEEVVIEDIDAKEDIKYYRDENAVHHVPKIQLKDLVLER